MAGKRGVRVTILGEDDRQVKLARRILLLLGFNRREVLERPVPAGKGSGEQWVRSDYPGQVGLIRSKGSYQKLALVVCIDADAKSVAERKQQLDEALEQYGLPKRSADEPIAILVATRNIETWFMHFADEEVDEIEDYRHRLKKPDFRRTAEGFVEEFRRFRDDPDSVETLPSLVAAYEELLRIV